MNFLFRQCFNFINFIIQLYSIWESSSLLKEKTTEAIILILMSAAGFMLMIDSENLIMLFIGLEIGSISLYALAGLNRGDKLSNEASLKYFLRFSCLHFNIWSLISLCIVCCSECI